MLSVAFVLALAASAHALARPRATTTWTNNGCYTDTSTSRTLAGASYSSASMTVESCQSFCSSGGYNLAGVEYGSQCYCDYAIQASAAVAAPSSCGMPCAGDSSESCGAGNFIDVYWNGQPLPTAPETVGGWKYEGCFPDSATARAMPHQQFLSTGVTIESCVSACQAGGYYAAGLEYAGECFCSAGLPTATPLSSASCATACTANTSEFCGGLNKLTVYANATASPQTCLSSTLSAAFNLQAVYVTPPATGATTLGLHVFIVNTVPMTSYDILTTGGSTFTSETLTNGGIKASSASSPELFAASIAVTAGESPTFVSEEFLPTSPNAYCVMDNPFLGPSGPQVLAVNGRSDLWALCTNSTAGGRLDLVYSPVAGHPGYNLTNCNSVYVTFD